MISAIVLAAGLSSRMVNQNKMLLPFNDKTVIVTVVESLIKSGVEEVIVVTGKDAEKVKDLLSHLRVIIIHNDDYKKGMTTSIQKGISLATGEGYMICLGDMPFITSDEYAQLIAFFLKQKLINNSCICVPEHDNIKGNPVIFSSSYKQEILKHDTMEGCKEIIQSNGNRVSKIKMRKGNVLKDIDTINDYENAIAKPIS